MIRVFAISASALLFWGVAISEQKTTKAPQPSALPTRVANAECAGCHQQIFKNYLETPMANASGLATDKIYTGGFHHQPSNIDYKVSKDNDELILSYSRDGDATVQGKQKLEYFLGSGHLGITYLYNVNGFFLESPVAYYANSKTYDMKPGLSKVTAMPSALPMTSGCMRCHMSDVQKEDSGSRNHFSGLPFLHAGVTCQSCHGDTSKHIAAKGKGTVINPIKLDARKRDSICISCHLEGDTRIEHAGKNALDFKPGDNISDFVSYFVYDNAKITSRGVSEVEELLESKCKRMSSDKMSCMSCHDPHYSPAEQDRGTFYRSKCLACHTEPKFATAHFPETQDCTSCHLPKGKAEKVPHIAWTDHRIRKTYGQGEITFEQQSPPELIPFISDNADPRDLALAYYDIVAGGNRAQAPRALKLLTEARKNHPDDLPVLTALGYLAQMQGNPTEAIEIYRHALTVSPVDPTVSNNLAMLLARSGKLKEAAELWKKIFPLNESTEEIGANLAAAQCRLGQPDEAAATLKRVLFYSPDRKAIRDKLRAIEWDRNTCTASNRN